ncbi:MAG: membrane protein insertase YidC [Alistipes sp.]|nr:membrane protein insertase YidC [Alistipes sp.]
MDKKTIVGLILMGAIFVGFVLYNNKQAEKYNEWRREQQIEQQKQAAEAEAERLAQAASEAQDTRSEEEKAAERAAAEERARQAEIAAVGEAVFAAAEAEAETVTIENSVMAIDFSTRGAKVTNVRLKEYTRYADKKEERTEPVELLQPQSAVFNMDLSAPMSGQKIATDDLVFRIVDRTEADGVTTLAMRLSMDPGESSYVEYIYKVYDTTDPSRDYLVDFDVRLHNMERYMSGRDEVLMRWRNRSNKNERGFQNENMATTIAFYQPSEGDMDTIEPDGSHEYHRDLMWLAFKQQYFASVFISRTPFNANMEFSTTAQEGRDYMKDFAATVAFPFDKNVDEYNFAFYYGPNDYRILKHVEFGGETIDLERMIPLGGWLVGWINRLVTIPIFGWLKDYLPSFGLIILILTLLVKAVIFPLTYKSYLSTAKMRVIRPEMEALNAKYPRKEDAMKKQQAMMELYRKAGINPMGGCLPLLIQMPILWALFRFFPASIELRGESFLWANDLSSYDSIIDLPFNIPFYGDHVSLFALLMTISIFAFSYYSYNQTSAGQPQMAGMKVMMVYVMPIMMLFFFNNYSSGLCYYYFLSQLITITQMYLIRRYVDDSKVRANIEAKAARPRKKSKFQQRYEEMLRQQQQNLNREQRRQR